MLPKCAIFITYKQLIQKLKTIREKTLIKQQCEKFVKDAFNDSFPSFISILKEINDQNIYEHDILNDLKSMIIKFSFAHKFFMKYDKIFQSMDWSLKGTLKYHIYFLFLSNSMLYSFSLIDYLKTLQKIGWLIFVHAKCLFFFFYLINYFFFGIFSHHSEK